MLPRYTYQSDLFKSVPENSGYLALYISESRCDIAICSSSFVLLFFESFIRTPEQSQTEFLKNVVASKQSLFAKHFQQVNIGVQNTDFTILPSNTAHKEQMLQLVSSGQGVAQSNKISFLDADLVYQIPEKTIQILEQTFEQPKITHATNVALQLARTTAKYDALLLIDDDYFDLIINKNEHIYSVNRHQYQQTEDVTYYTLLGLKDASIHAQYAKLLVSGKCDKNHSIYQNLVEFVANVDLKKINDHVKLRLDFDQPHQYAEYALNLLYASY